MSECVPSPSSGDIKSEPPVFKRALVDVTVSVGSETNFLVEIYSTSQPTVEWFHNEEKVGDSARLASTSTRHENLYLYCLHIREVNPSDEGKWSCRAQNVAGELSCFSVLKIQVPDGHRAPEFIKGLRGFLWDNGTLSLHCDVIGVPTPTLRWYRNGSELQAGSGLIIRANSKESKSLMGLFSCEAVNCMGSKSAFSKVYAKNFAQFLRQCAHMPVPLPKNPVPMPKDNPRVNYKSDIDISVDDSGIDSNSNAQ